MKQKRFTVRVYSRVDGTPTGEILLETDSYDEAHECTYLYNKERGVEYGDMNNLHTEAEKQYYKWYEKHLSALRVN